MIHNVYAKLKIRFDLKKIKKNCHCSKKKLFIIHDCNRVFQQRRPCHLRCLSQSQRRPCHLRCLSQSQQGRSQWQTHHQEDLHISPTWAIDHSTYTLIYCLQLPQHFSLHQQQPQPSPTTFCYNNRSPRHRQQPTQTATAATTGRPHQQQ